MELDKRKLSQNFWNEEELKNTLEFCLNGLKELHCNGITHGNLRPRNIVFCEDGDVKVVDQFAVS